ncbi:MAG: O-antigen ligase family protein [Putridiphycobacter sp.]
MFDKWLNLPAHYYLHLTALSILVIGLPLSNVLMSIGTIWIFANWLLEGNYKSKWVSLTSDKPLMAIVLLYVLFAVSIFWSQNLAYAGQDLLNKLPFIAIPFVMGTRQKIAQKEYRFLLFLFILSLLFTTIFNFIRYNNKALVDIRQMSFFISHIRLGMLISVGVFLLFYEVLSKHIKLILAVPVLLWLLYYTYLSQVMIAYLLLIILSLILVIYFIKPRWLKIGLIFSVFIGVFILGYSLNQKIKPASKSVQIKTNSLATHTVNGNPYFHDTTSSLSENGNLVWINVSETELRKEWNKKSTKNFDANGQEVFGALVRYMTSKNLKKDSLGFSQLTDQDIRNVEKGKVNDKKGLLAKLEKFYIDFYTFSDGGDPNGHSFFQRAEHLKTGINILKSNWVFGVGIGDVQQAFDIQYEKDGSKLKLENRHRAHNQILTIWISTGVLGLILALFILLSPFFNQSISFPLLVVSVSVLFGFLTQDIIETQAGVTFFGVFFGLINYHQVYGKNR